MAKVSSWGPFGQDDDDSEQNGYSRLALHQSAPHQSAPHQSARTTPSLVDTSATRIFALFVKHRFSLQSTHNPANAPGFHANRRTSRQ